jgi:hypothetical protein
MMNGSFDDCYNCILYSEQLTTNSFNAENAVVEMIHVNEVTTNSLTANGATISTLNVYYTGDMYAQLLEVFTAAGYKKGEVSFNDEYILVNLILEE